MAVILVVDDDKHFRGLIANLLEDWGHQTIEADDGSSAKDVLEKSKVDLIFSDNHMPQLSGLALVNWVRNHYDKIVNTSTPFILATAYTTLVTEEQAFQAGANEYLAKPIDQDKLQNVIKKYIAV
tara:strand:- start:671 stop:1045 length:375 start_codon:yes stop_codon:yes gene_type:complete